MPGKNDKTKAEPWRGIMKDVAKMMKEAVKEADQIVTEYQKHSEVEKPGTDTLIQMAVAIFEATVTAEAGRRMIEGQRQKNLMGGHLVIGHDGSKVRI